MSDTIEMYKDLKAFNQTQKSFNLNKSERFDDGKWVKHTPYHWSRIVDGKRLSFYPSTLKVIHDNKRVNMEVLKQFSLATEGTIVEVIRIENFGWPKTILKSEVIRHINETYGHDVKELFIDHWKFNSDYYVGKCYLHHITAGRKVSEEAIHDTDKTFEIKYGDTFVVYTI